MLLKFIPSQLDHIHIEAAYWKLKISALVADRVRKDFIFLRPAMKAAGEDMVRMADIIIGGLNYEKAYQNDILGRMGLSVLPKQA